MANNRRQTKGRKSAQYGWGTNGNPATVMSERENPGTKTLARQKKKRDKLVRRYLKEMEQGDEVSSINGDE